MNKVVHTLRAPTKYVNEVSDEVVDVVAGIRPLNREPVCGVYLPEMFVAGHENSCVEKPVVNDLANSTGEF